MSRKQRKRKKQPRMTSDEISKVQEWLGRIHQFAMAAVDLSNQMTISDMSEADHRFWTLVKYAENVEESITQLDKLNKRILPCLVEIPKETDSSGDTSWADLKGMRVRLAHKFWDINPEILWSTVREDFPKLVELLSKISLIPEPIGERYSTYIEVDDLLALSPTDSWDALRSGQSLISLGFTPKGVPEVMRIGWEDEQGLVIVTSASLAGARISLFGEGRKEKEPEHEPRMLSRVVLRTRPE